MLLLLARPRGFCAGVERALETVERALERHGAPIWVLHEIVHNRAVLDDLAGRGVRFVERLDEVPDGAVTILSAHGVSDRVEEEAHLRGLRVIDATCPLVTKVHEQARRYRERGREIVLVGHAGHPEVEGTRGRVRGPVHLVSSVADVEVLEVENAARLAYVTQTTLSVDDTREVIEALQRRFPAIEGPRLSDICYATQNRQDAVRAMNGRIDRLVVVGSANSSNSARLRELGERLGVPSHLIDDPGQVDPRWTGPDASVGVTAGASAPESLVRSVVARLVELGGARVEELPAAPEGVTFRLPAIA